MGRRRTLNVPQILKTDGGQEQNDPEQPYMAPLGASGSSPIIHPTVNIQGGSCPSSAPMSNGHQGSILNAELAHNEIEAPGSLHKHVSAPSPSSLCRQTGPRTDEGFHDQAVGRVSQKRKNPFVPQIGEMGPTSRYYDVGSSSNSHLPAGPSQQKHNAASHPTPWEYPPGYVTNSLSIGRKSSTRDVRSRGNVDSTHLPINFPNLSFSGRSTDQTRSVGFSRQSSNTPTMALGSHISRAGHVATMGSADFGQNTLSSVDDHSNVSEESGGYSNSGSLNSNTLSQFSSSYLDWSFGRLQSGIFERLFPTSGASSSNFPAVQLTATNEGGPTIADSTRHRRFLSSIRALNSERNVRIRMPSYRFRPYAHEGYLVAARSALDGPSNPFDQHRDMRLDVDNMSYEELLLLGERIGSVSTGLSDDLISKCLTESVLCSADHSDGDGSCVICLEEYKDMDDLGNLKCGHDFHVGCIKKWLSTKNLCPICKTSAMHEENKKEICQ